MRLGVLATAGCLVALVAPAAAEGGTPPIGFSAPVIVIPSPPGGESTAPVAEPHMAVASSGRVFVSAGYESWDCETGRVSAALRDCVWASDNDSTFHVRGGEPDGDGGDNTDLAVMPSGTVLESTMTDPDIAGATLGSGTLGATVSRSADGGHTWTEVVDANHQVVSDRPYLLVAADNNLLLTFAPLPGGIWAVRSTDGGASFGAAFPIALGTIAVNGSPLDDHVRGDLVVPFATSSLPTCVSGFDACFNQLAVARSDNGGQSWTTETVADLPSGIGITGPPIATADAGGAEYIVFGTAAYTDAGEAAPVGPAHVWVVRSPAAGKPWSAPIEIDPPGGSAMMPAGVAAGRGHLAVVFYRTADPNGEDDTTASWNVMVASSGDAGSRFAQTLVARGAYLGAGYNRVPILIDQIDIAFDPKGRVLIVWTDTHKLQGTANTIDFAHQTTGPPLADY